ncbi:fructosamine-3-kinase [Nocardia tenerifensis]|uniref:Fructosamine-3-kinase n=1 Tax=Nocardia tenerifensis TaxID=228006 RepID=A0A318JPM7_9NOCA|nr:fructosamine kinase family protein [Nocardia tenerifensis]PXX57400.1 fructosamine-3-kinase [Nocardia tenerifensis]
MVVEVLADQLAAAGFDVTVLEQMAGGCICIAGVAVLRDGSRVFAKTLPDADVFEVEAAGLSALAQLGGVRVPAVAHVSPRLLVLEALQPRGEDEQFWEQLAHMVAALHTSTVTDRFGWHRDGWHGRMRQENAWETDGYQFYAQHRILRWLREKPVREEFDRDQRRAIERLCLALPELIPPHPPSLTHGDMWPGNILTDSTGKPALIDPAVSYCWPEIDLAALWCQPRPPASDRFFAVYEDLTPPCDGWRDHAQLLRVWDLFSVIAHGLDTWGAARIIHELLAPHRRRRT